MKLIKRLHELLRGIKGYQEVSECIRGNQGVSRTSWYQTYQWYQSFKMYQVCIRMKHLDCRDITVTFIVLEMDILVMWTFLGHIKDMLGICMEHVKDLLGTY